jgi:hypothetical protein
MSSVKRMGKCSGNSQGGEVVERLVYHILKLTIVADGA